MVSTAEQAVIVADRLMSDPRIDQRPPAPVRLRALARVLDLLTVFMILWMMSVLQILWFMDRLSGRFSPEPWGRPFVAIVTFVVLAAAYETYFLRRNMGQTPGKDVCKIRVIHGDQELSWGRSFGRATATSLPWLCPAIWISGALALALGAPAVTRSGLAAHDLAAGTRVVKYDRTLEDPDAPPPPPFFRRKKLIDETELEDQ